MEREIPFTELKDVIVVLTKCMFMNGPQPTYNFNSATKKETVQHANWLVQRYNNIIKKDPKAIFLNVYKYRIKEDQILEIISEQNEILMMQDKIKQEIGI